MREAVDIMFANVGNVFAFPIGIEDSEQKIVFFLFVAINRPYYVDKM